MASIAIAQSFALVATLGHAVVVSFDLPSGALSDSQLARRGLSGEAFRAGVGALVGVTVAVVSVVWMRRKAEVPHRPFVVGALLALCVGGWIARPDRDVSHVDSASLAADSIWAYPGTRELAWATLILGPVLGWLIAGAIVRRSQPRLVMTGVILLAVVLTGVGAQSVVAANEKVDLARTWHPSGSADELRMLESDPLWRDPAIRASYARRKTYFSTATRTLSDFGVEGLTTRSFLLPGGRQRFRALDAAAKQHGWKMQQCFEDGNSLGCNYEKTGRSAGDAVRLETRALVATWIPAAKQTIEVTQEYSRRGDS